MSHPHPTHLKGTNQSGMRDYNERLVMALIRKSGGLSKTDIAKQTGLSLQTTSVIMRGLEAEGFLKKGPPIRGKVGQPSVPMFINEEGAYFFGLKIGRRSVDLILIDFLGQIIRSERRTYDHPTPQTVLSFTTQAINTIIDSLPLAQSSRIAGCGIAMPGQLWNWAQILEIAQEEMDQWKDIDVKSHLEAHYPFPIYMQNDTTAACGAELTFGTPQPFHTFLYIYIGFFIGGGLVLNGSLHTGSTGNAGAIGSMPIPHAHNKNNQLINMASIASLEQKLKRTGYDTTTLWTLPDLEDATWRDEAWQIDFAPLHRWMSEVSDSIAYALTASLAVFDFEGIVIDGWFPNKIRQTLVSEIQAKFETQNTMGLNAPHILEGSIGHNARALGAASLPLSERFLV